MKSTHPTFYGVSIFLISMAIIAFQLELIQILSMSQWDHFAYLIISVALMGFGAAGTALSLFSKTLLKSFDKLFTALCFLFSLSLVCVPYLSMKDFFLFDSFLLFMEFENILGLISSILLFSTPFFLVALIICLTFMKFKENVATFYFCNLVGSSLGAILLLPLMWHFSPQTLIPMTATLPLLAGLLTIPAKKKATTLTLSLLCSFSLFYFLIKEIELKVSQFKDISYAKQMPEVTRLEKVNSPYGKIEVLKSRNFKRARGMSLNYKGKIPNANLLFLNGNSMGPLLNDLNLKSYQAYSPSALAYNLRPLRDVLILNSTSHNDLFIPMIFKSEKVKIIAKIPPLTPYLQKSLKNMKSETSYKFLSLSPRAFLKQSRNKFDLITLSPPNSFSGSSGLYSLSPNYLFTKESFDEIWTHLKPNGLLSLSSWFDYPHTNTLKLTAQIMEMLEDKNLKPLRDHLVMTKSWGMVNILVSKSKLSGSDKEKIENFTKKMGFSTIKENQSHEDLDKYILKVISEDRDSFYKSYALKIIPASDDSPFFSQFIKWKSWPTLIGQFDKKALPFFALGQLTSLLSLVLISITSLLLIILPLVLKLKSKGLKTWTLLYFIGIGTGFMFIEITLIHYFILYFSTQLYAISFVISSLLLSSGIGSYYSKKLNILENRTYLPCILIIILLLLLSQILPVIISSTISSGLIIKAIITFLCLAPLGLVMGMPMPLGLNILASKSDEAQMAWAFGINGVSSVVATSLATILAVEFGFTLVLIFSALAYFLALVAHKMQ